jgi:hypothetical protein
MASKLGLHNIKRQAFRNHIDFCQKYKKLAAATFTLDSLIKILSGHNHCKWEAR